MSKASYYFYWQAILAVCRNLDKNESAGGREGAVNGQFVCRRHNLITRARAVACLHVRGCRLEFKHSLSRFLSDFVNAVHERWLRDVFAQVVDRVCLECAQDRDMNS
jgi:hypothetical protein